MAKDLQRDLRAAASRTLASSQSHQRGYGGMMGEWKELAQLGLTFSALRLSDPSLATADPLAKAVSSFLRTSQSHQVGFGGSLGRWPELDALSSRLQSLAETEKSTPGRNQQADESPVVEEYVTLTDQVLQAHPEPESLPRSQWDREDYWEDL